MVTVDEGVLSDPVRLAAVARARRVLPASPMPLDRIARLAARLLGTPMGLVTLVGQDQEYFAGVHGAPDALVGEGHAPIAYSVCQYMVSADHPVCSGDMSADDDPRLRDHLLTRKYGVRAFLGVPLRDSDDRPVGSLTVLDTDVRHWSDEQLSTLVELGDLLHPAPGDGPGDGPAPAAEARDTSAVAGLDIVSLLDGVQEAFLAVDPDGVVVGCNPAAQTLLGYGTQQICARHVHDTVLPDYDDQPIGAALRQLLAAPQGRRVFPQVQMRHADGHRLTVRVSVSVVRGSTGSLVGVFVTDLSAQLTAEDEADRQRSFLTALLDSLSVGVIACDADARVVLINRALREVQHLPLTGPVRSEHAAAAAAMLFDDSDEPMRREDTPLMRAWRGEHVHDTDVVIRAAGARARTFACNARPIIGADGRRWGAVVAAHEVTALRRTENFRACHAAVAEALVRSGSAAEAAPAMLEAVATTLQWPHAQLWLVDEVTDALVAAGHWSAPGTHLDELVGPAVVKGEGITGRVWSTGAPLWVPDITNTEFLRTPEWRARVQACVEQGIHTVLSVPIRDGNTLLGVLTCYAGAPEFHEDQLTVLLDGVAGQIGVFLALRRAEELDRQLTRSKDDFIALVGHEMRTPLTSIAAYAAILADDPGIADEDHREMLRTVERNTVVLRDIVDTLLDLAGLDSGHLALAIEPCDVAAIVAAAAAAAATGAVRVHTDLPEQLLVDADRHRLRQLVEHLLANAVAYSRPGDHVHVQLRVEDAVVHLRVTDTGIGIPAGERRFLFDRFYRASNVRHQGVSGAGLGLSVVHTIVRMHGGTITIIDREPSGTTVLVRLPQHAARN